MCVSYAHIKKLTGSQVSLNKTNRHRLPFDSSGVEICPNFKAALQQKCEGLGEGGRAGGGGKGGKGEKGGGSYKPLTTVTLAIQCHVKF